MTIGSGSSDNRGFTKTFTPLSGGGHSESSIGGYNRDWSEWESSTNPTPLDNSDLTTGTSYQLAGGTSDFLVITTDIRPGVFSWNRSEDFQTGESTRTITATPQGTNVAAVLQHQRRHRVGE